MRQKFIVKVASLSRNKEKILPKKREWYKFSREAELERGRKYKEQTKRRAARKLMTEAAVSMRES